MNKRETIDLIRRYNPTAPAEFLAEFDLEELTAYLHQLQELEREHQEELRKQQAGSYVMAAS